MTTRMEQALKKQNDNYIFPFYWLHGEDEETLREYMRVMNEMGIGAVCIESRPHPDFVGEKWWQDVDVIMDEARKRGMKVWILDDYHFPSGYANGAMADADPSLQKWVVYHQIMDLAGPDHVNVELTSLLEGFQWNNPQAKPNPLNQPKELICAVLYKRKDEESSNLEAEAIDLTGNIVNGYLPVDVPDGFYRLFIVYRIAKAGITFNDYVNFLTKDSVKGLLDAVYEPHYEHYKEDFGKTLAGFFSDEPGFYNTLDNIYSLDGIIGKKQMPLPWSAELEECLRRRGMKDADLVRLWYATDKEQDARCRYIYMDCVTMLYQQNYNCQVGDWCRERGAEYIGHIVEDNNASSRLGPSAGHYFRALAGQDMSGIDVVNLQILPGKTNTYYTPNNAAIDGEFFHYALSKLAASDAHTDLRKKGRAMVELFGCYGWSEGLQMMKWMADFMLVRGLNQFVPHAFSPKPFPDPAAPPHLYAQGHNMQSAYMDRLFPYMNRAAHIFSGGRSASRIGILYQAESEWTGERQLFQKPGRVCMEHQADYDVISVDRLLAEDVVLLETESELKLSVGTLLLECLVIPYAEHLPILFLEKLAELSEAGFPVLFIDALPGYSCEGEDCEQILQRLQASAVIMTLAQLGTYIEEQQLAVLSAEDGSRYKNLRAYQYEGEGYQAVMLMNESISETVCGKVCFHNFVPRYAYDIYHNQLYRTNCEDGRIMISLEPGESGFFVCCEEAWDVTDEYSAAPAKKKSKLQPKLKVSVSAYEDQGCFRELETAESLKDYITDVRFQSFHGIIRYAFDLALPEDTVINGKETLYLDGANEVVKVMVNGKETDTRIAAPYRFAVGDALKRGSNHIVIEHVTTVYPKVKDKWSIHNTLHALGLTGNIWLEER